MRLSSSQLRVIARENVLDMFTFVRYQSLTLSNVRAYIVLGSLNTMTSSADAMVAVNYD